MQQTKKGRRRNFVTGLRRLPAPAPKVPATRLSVSAMHRLSVLVWPTVEASESVQVSPGGTGPAYAPPFGMGRARPFLPGAFSLGVSICSLPLIQAFEAPGDAPLVLARLLAFGTRAVL